MMTTTTVDAIRQRVGFEEDLRRRRADLEKAFISSHRACPPGDGCDVCGLFLSKRGPVSNHLFLSLTLYYPTSIQNKTQPWA